MLATFFEWRIHPGREEQFRHGWDAVTRMLHDKGSHGSALFTNAAGNMCAFAMWPDRLTRDRAFASGTESTTEPYLAMRDAIMQEVQRMDLDCIHDQWRMPGSIARDDQGERTCSIT